MATLELKQTQEPERRVEKTPKQKGVALIEEREEDTVTEENEEEVRRGRSRSQSQRAKRVFECQDCG